MRTDLFAGQVVGIGVAAFLDQGLEPLRIVRREGAQGYGKQGYDREDRACRSKTPLRGAGP